MWLFLRMLPRPCGQSLWRNAIVTENARLGLITFLPCKHWTSDDVAGALNYFDVRSWWTGRSMY
jgi:hypothetical protein